MKEEIKPRHVLLMWCVVISILSIIWLVSQSDIEPVSEHVAELRWEELK